MKVLVFVESKDHSKRVTMNNTESSFSLEISTTFGVATSRYISCLPSKEDPFVIDVTLGAFVVRWGVREKKQLHSFQAHTDLITCMIHKETKVNTPLSFSRDRINFCRMEQES